MSPGRRETLVLYGLVALGAAIGGTARALVGLALAGSAFPWATLAVNVVGSFVIGLYAGLTGPEGRLMATGRSRQFVMTGICGGFTTFSLFGLETVRLATHAPPLAALYVGLSLLLWFAAVWYGDALAARLNRPRRTP